MVGFTIIDGSIRALLKIHLRSILLFLRQLNDSIQELILFFLQQLNKLKYQSGITLIVFRAYRNKLYVHKKDTSSQGSVIISGTQNGTREGNYV